MEEREAGSSNLELARALGAAQRRSLELAQERARAAVAQSLIEISLYAKGFCAEVSRGFELKGFDTRLEWSAANPSLLAGVVRLEKEHMNYEASFECAYDEAPEAAVKEALRSLMNEHPWFSDGFSEERLESWDELSGDDRSAAQFARGLPEIGPAGAQLSRMLKLESEWSGARWSAQRELEESLERAAEAGLLPAAFAHANAHLIQGWPGEPLLLTSLTLETPGSFMGYRSNDAVESREELAPGADWKAWSLPSLEAGREAIWSAFCVKAAQAQERGWPSLSVGQNSEEQRMARAAAIDRELIAEETLSPGAPRRPWAL